MSDTEFRPITAVRPNQIYISWSLHKALGYVARKTGRTREDVAETVLNTWLAQEHGEIVQWLQARAADEEAFLKKLKPIPFE